MTTNRISGRDVAVGVVLPLVTELILLTLLVYAAPAWQIEARASRSIIVGCTLVGCVLFVRRRSWGEALLIALAYLPIMLFVYFVSAMAYASLVWGRGA